MKKHATYLYNNCRLCSKHFEDVMFTSHLKNRLLDIAEPTIFDIPNPPSETILCKRKPPANRENMNFPIKKKRKIESSLDTTEKDAGKEVTSDIPIVEPEKCSALIAENSKGELI